MIRKYMLKNILIVILLFSVSGFAAEEQKKTVAVSPAPSAVPSPESIRQHNDKIAKELDQVSTGLAPNSGKQAVAKRLAALFRGAPSPIIQTKDYVPVKPYIVVHDIISKDPLDQPRSVIIYKLRFMQANDKTQDAIEGLIGESGTVEFSEKQNMVVLNVPKDRAEIVKQMLLALDQPTPQVLVETQVVEILVEHGQERDVTLQYSQREGTDDSTLQQIGYSLTNPGQNSGNSNQSSGFSVLPVNKTYSDGGYKQLQAAIKWLATSTDSKILAAPNIIAEMGTDAKMTTGEEIPYAEAAITNTAVSQNIKFKKTGINLSIKPIVINDDTVRLEIKPEIIMAVRYQTFVANESQSTVPVVSIRNISTTLTASDGEIIMLGGLYSSETTEEKRKTPFLSDLPLFGNLFTARSLSVADKQLIFFMKIHILKNPYSVMLDVEKNADILQDIGRSLRISEVMFKSDDNTGTEKKYKKELFSMESLKDPEAFWDSIFDGEAESWTRIDKSIKLSPVPAKRSAETVTQTADKTDGNSTVEGNAPKGK